MDTSLSDDYGVHSAILFDGVNIIICKVHKKLTGVGTIVDRYKSTEQAGFVTTVKSRVNSW